MIRRIVSSIAALAFAGSLLVVVGCEPENKPASPEVNKPAPPQPGTPGAPSTPPKTGEEKPADKK